MRSRLFCVGNKGSDTLSSPDDFDVESHKPHLSDEAYATFKKLIEDYISQIPSDSAIDSVEKYNENDFITECIKNNELAHSIAEKSVKTLISILLYKARNEFIAVGQNDTTEEFKQLRIKLDEAIRIICIELNQRRGMYKRLMHNLINSPEIESEELKQRMIDHLFYFGEQIKKSPIMPNRPKWYKLKDLSNYESWLKSKNNLVEKASLPNVEEILNDYFISADAAFRRSLYGSRDAILDKGEKSDNIDEIDRFQRRFYDQLGGYRLALSPLEWATSQLNEYLNYLLYDPNSDISKFLDDSARKDGVFVYRINTRNDRKNQHNRAEFESNIFNERQSLINEFYTSEYYKEPFIDVGKNKIQLYWDIVLMVDSKFVELPPNKRRLLLDTINNIIKQFDYKESSAVIDQNDIHLYLVLKIIKELHPDKENGDEELCKIMTAIYQDLKVKVKDKHIY